jgi:hypothetical protein
LEFLLALRGRQEGLQFLLALTERHRRPPGNSP